MSKFNRKFFVLFVSALAWMFLAVAAQALCEDECDPYNSYCGQECDVCRGYNPDGSCLFYHTTTCGATSSACLSDTCTPSWYESNRTNVGTYDGNSINSCTHHSVDSVTVTDANACNINAAYRSYTYCDDYIDGHKCGGFYPSCCNGYSDDYPYQALSCNGYHSCS